MCWWCVDENSKEISELLRLSNILDIYSNDCVFFLSCVFYKRPIHSGMAEGISKHIKRCHICSLRSPLKSGLCEICEREGFFKSEACKRCESHTTQLFCEVKTTRNLCLKCQDFTEKVDSLIQTEIDLCQDCHVPMKSLSDEIEFICPRCSLVRKKPSFLRTTNRRFRHLKALIF